MVRGLVADQERGLLKEHAAEVNLVLGSSITNVSTRLNLVGTVARLSNGSAESFADAYITKPVTRATLGAVLGQVIDGPPPARQATPMGRRGRA